MQYLINPKQGAASYTAINMKKTTHGGKRTNAGRPKGEPTSTISYRVKDKHKAEIKAKIEDILKDYK